MAYNDEAYSQRGDFMEHKLIVGDSTDLSQISDKSVQLVVTSPPYPMIEMWDEVFAEQDSSIKDDLDSGNGLDAFYKMHAILNKVWDECDRVLEDNGFVCINVGDATRTLGKTFQLFSNHTAIINHFLDLGYCVLPDVHWRKQSNAPNKFMGSGMYPAGAYVTYEHEYILIFRKGGKRTFTGAKKALRQESAFFWEERNVWFSDLWEIKGKSQMMPKSAATRNRNASFPFDIPYRLVNMYSTKGDVVLDPFCGLGTTNLACIAAERNSIGVDIDFEVISLAEDIITEKATQVNRVIQKRINDHLAFIEALSSDKKNKCYINKPHDFLVKTRQETALKIKRVKSVERKGNIFISTYEE